MIENLYILSLPFTSAFALKSFLPLPLLISFILTFKFIFIKNIKFKISIVDIILFIFLFMISISYICNLFILRYSPKLLNHFSSYFITLLFYYFIIKNILYIYVLKKGINKVLKFVLLSVLLASIFGTINFLGKNFFGFDLDNYIYRPMVENMNALAIGFYRSRSFIEEPGHFAMFLEIFFPLSLYYLLNIKVNKNYIILYSFIVIISFLFTFSTAGIMISIISIFSVFIYYLFQNKSVLKNIYLYKQLFYILIFLLVILSIFNYYGLFDLFQLIEYINSKLNGSNSSNDRLDRVHEALSLFSNSGLFHILFGFGPGGYLLYIKSIISLYLLLLLETGIIGLFLFILFQFLVLKHILSLNSNIKYYFLFSFISATFHYSLISNYWYPWYWFLIVLIEIQYYLELKRKKNVYNI